MPLPPVSACQITWCRPAVLGNHSGSNHNILLLSDLAGRKLPCVLSRESAGPSASLHTFLMMGCRHSACGWRLVLLVFAGQLTELFDQPASFTQAELAVWRPCLCSSKSTDPCGPMLRLLQRSSCSTLMFACFVFNKPVWWLSLY